MQFKVVLCAVFNVYGNDALVLAVLYFAFRNVRDFNLDFSVWKHLGRSFRHRVACCASSTSVEVKLDWSRADVHDCDDFYFLRVNHDVSEVAYVAGENYLFVEMVFNADVHAACGSCVHCRHAGAEL